MKKILKLSKSFEELTKAKEETRSELEKKLNKHCLGFKVEVFYDRSEKAFVQSTESSAIFSVDDFVKLVKKLPSKTITLEEFDEIN